MLPTSYITIIITRMNSSHYNSSETSGNWTRFNAIMTRTLIIKIEATNDDINQKIKAGL